MAAASNDFSGYSVSGAGDVNGDGLDDLVIGSYYASRNGKTNAGTSYVIFGSPMLGSIGTIELSNLTNPVGLVINGAASNDFSGYSVSGAGDVNGDGLDDLVIGGYYASRNGKAYAGVSYVILGNGIRLSKNRLSLISGGSMVLSDNHFNISIEDSCLCRLISYFINPLPQSVISIYLFAWRGNAVFYPSADYAGPNPFCS